MAYWIFQTNPNKYDWFSYIAKNRDKPDTWPVVRFRDEVNKGDIIFVWLSNNKSGKGRGIYAEGKVLDPPKYGRIPYLYEKPEWKDSDEKKKQEKNPRIEAQYIKVFEKKPLLWNFLKSIRGLEKLCVGVAPRGANPFRVSPEEGKIIESLICRN